MDEYFRQQLVRMDSTLEQRVASVNRLALEMHSKDLLDSVAQIWAAQDALKQASSSATDSQVLGDVDTVVKNILAGYHAHREVALNNPNPIAATLQASHYGNMSLVVHYGNSLIDPRSEHAWRSLPLERGAHVVAYAHDLGGNKKRAMNAVENITRNLGNPVPEDDPYSHFIGRDVTVTNKFGVHARPAALLVKAASQYPGEIMIRSDGRTESAKSIMGILTLGAEKGARLSILFEPGRNGQGTTQEVYRSIEQAVTYES